MRAFASGRLHILAPGVGQRGYSPLSDVIVGQRGQSPLDTLSNVRMDLCSQSANIGLLYYTLRLSIG